MAVKSESNLADRQWTITREFNAPRDVVYRAWTDPKQVARWWGPKAFTNPVCELDVRPGGKYVIAMQSPDGQRYPMRGVYREVIKNEKIVYTNELNDNPDSWKNAVMPNRRKDEPVPEVITHVAFTDSGSKTLVTVTMVFETPELKAGFVKVGMNEGWSGSFDKLDEFLWNK